MDSKNSWIGQFNNNTFIFNKVDITEDITYQNFNIESKNIGLPKHNNFPFGKVPFFIKRNKDILLEIINFFQDIKENDNSETLIPIIKGFSGEGKTSIVSEFIFSQGSNFIACLYLDANFDIEPQVEKFAEIHLEIQINFEQDKIRIRQFKLEAVKFYIKTHKVLVILDNVEHIENIAEYIPQTGKSRAIVLTNNLTSFSEAEFKTFELKQISDLDAYKILAYDIKDIDFNHPDLPSIFNEVGFSPYALERANIILRDNKNISLKEFLSIIKKDSLRWESFTKYGNSFSLRSINKTATIYSLLEKKALKLNENEVDRLTYNFLNVIASLIKARCNFDYNFIFYHALELKSDDKILVNKVVQRLKELSFCIHYDDIFIFKELDRKFISDYFSNIYFDFKVASKFYQQIENTKSIELMLGTLEFQFEKTLYLKNLALNIQISSCNQSELDTLYRIHDDVINSFEFYGSWIAVFKHLNKSIDANLNEIHNLINRQEQILEKLDLFKSVEWLKTIYKRAKAYHFCGDYKHALLTYEKLLQYINTNLDIEILLDAMLESISINFILNNKDTALKIIQLFQDNLLKVYQDKRIRDNIYDKFIIRVKVIEWINSSPEPESIVVSLSDEIIDLAEKYRENYFKDSPNYTLSSFLKQGELKRYPIDIALYMNPMFYYKPASIGDLLDITLIKDVN